MLLTVLRSNINATLFWRPVGPGRPRRLVLEMRIYEATSPPTFLISIGACNVLHIVPSDMVRACPDFWGTFWGTRTRQKPKNANREVAWKPLPDCVLEW